MTIRFRLRGDKKTCRFLNELAGVNRYLWNAALAKAKDDYEETGQSQTSQFDFYTWYKVHKDTVAPWLREYPVNATRTGLKDLADGLQAVLQEKAGVPQIQEKRQGEKKLQRRCVRGKDVFNEWICSAKAGHACEDAAILSSEPLHKPRTQDGPHL